MREILRLAIQNRQGLPDPAFEVLRQKLTCLEKRLLSVWATEDQLEEIEGLLVRDPLLPPNLLTEKANLLLHDIAQAQPSWHGLSRVFSGQDLRR